MTDLQARELEVYVDGARAEIVDFAAHFAAEPAARTPEQLPAPAAPVAAAPEAPRSSRVWLVYVDLSRIANFRRTIAVRAGYDFGPPGHPMNPRLRREYERMRDALAASGVTVYSIYAWNDGLVEFGAQQAFEGNVLDMSASAPDLSGIPFGSTMAALAADTGGESLTATSGLLDRLDRAERARSGSYSVAFRTPPGSAGKRLDIRVRVTRPGLRVHHRRLLRLGSDDDASGHTSMAALLSSAGENPSGIRVQVGSLTRDRLRRLRARVKIHIPADRVVFIERQGRHRGQLRFFASVRDAKGIYSSFDPRELTLDLSDAELSALRRNGTTYELELVASQGTTEVSVTVLDVPGRSHSTARFALDGGRG